MATPSIENVKFNFGQQLYHLVKVEQTPNVDESSGTEYYDEHVVGRGQTRFAESQRFSSRPEVEELADQIQKDICQKCAVFATCNPSFAVITGRLIRKSRIFIRGQETGTENCDLPTQ